MLRLLLAAMLYSATFHYAYVVYVYPVFEYAHYNYIERMLPQIFLTYLHAAAPVVAYRSSTAPASFGVVLIFVICYVPAQLMLLFTLDRPFGELTLVQVSLAASMAILLWASSLGGGDRAQARSERHLSAALRFLTVASMVLLVFYYHQHMRLVSFEDVYDLRFETNELVKSTLAGYLLSWLSYCFLPFYFARGVIRKSWGDFGLGFLGSLLIYLATGSKAAILMPLVIYSLHLLIGSGKDFLLRLMIVMTVVVFLVIELLPDEGVLMWVKSILLIRVLGTSGWTISTYYDYFSTNGFTFYTHIGPINALTGAYPYGEYSLGQTIGLFYSGSSDANFNANFWASDGFAAMGVLGIPVVTAIMVGVFYAINRIASGYSPRFVVLWLSGFWLALLNLPLTTALLSGGGGLTLFLLWANRVRLGTRGKPSRFGDFPGGSAAAGATPAKAVARQPLVDYFQYK
jgi:hypothetical protein